MRPSAKSALAAVAVSVSAASPRNEARCARAPMRPTVSAAAARSGSRRLAKTESMNAGSSRRVSSMRSSRAWTASCGDGVADPAKRQELRATRRAALERRFQREAKVLRNCGEPAVSIDRDERRASGSESSSGLRIGDQVVEGDGA